MQPIGNLLNTEGSGGQLVPYLGYVEVHSMKRVEITPLDMMEARWLTRAKGHSKWMNVMVEQNWNIKNCSSSKYIYIFTTRIIRA